jgi:hydroxyethylthiazole kinase-like uncharacterized protein yjeF
MTRLTREQVREIDRRSIGEYHIPGIVLMENAARGAADVAMKMLAGIEMPSAMILCGGGNNGGDGMALARHLHNRGVHVEVCRDWSKQMKGDSAINLNIIQSMGNAIDRTPLIEAASSFRGVDLVVDGLFGTGLTRPLDAATADIVDEMNQKMDWMVLSLDLPSGLDCDTGEPTGACVRATETVTFVAEKLGFANPASREYTGRITVADIGCPRELIGQVSRTNQQSPDP